MVKNNTGKKMSVLRDEYGVTGGGLYAVTPFDKIDAYGNTLFKIGISLNLNKRIDGYHTLIPTGLYICDILENPSIKRGVTKTAKYKEIENFIFKEIIKNDGIRIFSTTRVQNPNKKKEGATEWFYTNETTVKNAFTEAYKYFGGKLFHKPLPLLNAMFARKIKKQPNYLGNIIFTFDEN